MKLLNMENENYWVKSPVLKTYREKQMACEAAFSDFGPIYHLYTPNNMELLFVDEEDLKFGVNLLAICLAQFSELKILTFAIMNNHIHLVVGGEESSCREYFELYRKKLIRNRKLCEVNQDFSQFTLSLLPIHDIKVLRNTIVYVNRNRYVVDASITPFSDRWSGGGYFYNTFSKEVECRSYNKMGQKERRAITRSRDIVLPDSYLVYNGMIYPPSFCCIEQAEKCFLDAHNYFNALVKDFEAFSDVAGSIGDKGFLADNEMFSVISKHCRSKYEVKQMSKLCVKDKIDVAKLMHFSYNASNGQIARFLNIAPKDVEELFPKAR